MKQYRFVLRKSVFFLLVQCLLVGGCGEATSEFSLVGSWIKTDNATELAFGAESANSYREIVTGSDDDIDFDFRGTYSLVGEELTTTLERDETGNSNFTNPSVTTTKLIIHSNLRSALRQALHIPNDD